MTATMLAEAGVHPAVARQILRHSDIRLTMHRYTHTYREQQGEAVRRLPDLTAPSRQQQEAAATGTDGPEKPPAKIPAKSLAKSCGKRRTSADSGGQKGQEEPKIENAPKLAVEPLELRFLTGNAVKTPVRVVGLEPTTHGLKGRCSAD